jgi:hypothetical protein
MEKRMRGEEENPLPFFFMCEIPGGEAAGINDNFINVDFAYFTILFASFLEARLPGEIMI